MINRLRVKRKPVDIRVNYGIFVGTLRETKSFPIPDSRSPSPPRSRTAYTGRGKRCPNPRRARHLRSVVSVRSWNAEGRREFWTEGIGADSAAIPLNTTIRTLELVFDRRANFFRRKRKATNRRRVIDAAVVKSGVAPEVDSANWPHDIRPSAKRVAHELASWLTLTRASVKLKK